MSGQREAIRGQGSERSGQGIGEPFPCLLGMPGAPSLPEKRGSGFEYPIPAASSLNFPN